MLIAWITTLTTSTIKKRLQIMLTTLYRKTQENNELFSLGYAVKQNNKLVMKNFNIAINPGSGY